MTDVRKSSRRVLSSFRRSWTDACFAALTGVIASVALVSTPSAQAATDTWIGSTSVNFSTVNGFNTVPGVNGTDTLIFGADGTAGTAASHVLNNDLTNLVLLPAGNTPSISFTAAAPAYTIGGNPIQIGSTSVGGTPVASTSATITNSSTVNAQTFTAAVSYDLASSFVLSLNPGAGLNFTGGLNNAGPTNTNNTIAIAAGTVTTGNFGLGGGGTGVIVNGAGNLAVNGAVSANAGTTPGFQFQGTGMLTLNGTNTNTGTNNYNTTTGGGTTLITGNDVAATGATAVGLSNGMLSTLTLNSAGKLGGTLSATNATVNVDNTTALVASRLSGKALNLTNSTLNYTSNNGATASTESVAVLTVAGGLGSTINLTSNATSGTTLTATNIGRSATGSTLLLTGNNVGAAVGANSVNLIPTANGTNAAAVGGAGAAGSTTIAIEPFILIQDTAQTGNAQYGLVTDVGTLTTTGLRNLTAAEYANTITDASTVLNNVSLTTGVTGLASATTTINALRLDNGGGVTIGGTLTLNAGEVLGLAGNTGISGGTLAFATREAIFRTPAALAVSSNITGTGGLTKSDAGALTLSGVNTYTGTTTINQGTVNLGSASTFTASTTNGAATQTSGPLGATPAVILANNATAALNLNGFDTAIGSLSGGGPVGGTVALGSNTLTLGTNNTAATFSGAITGTAAIVNKIGTATQTLSGTSTLANTSAFNILQGQLTTSGTTALGSAVINLGDTTAGNSNNAALATTVSITNAINVRAGSSGTLTILTGNNQNVSGPVVLGTGTTPQNVTLQSNGGGVAGFNSAVTGFGNVNILNNQSGGALATQFAAASSFNQVGTISNVSTGTNTVTFGATIRGNVTGLIQNSVEPLAVTVANPLFTGDTTVTSGTLNLQNSLALQNSVVVTNSTAGTETFGASATSGLTAVSLGGLQGNGSVNLNNTLTVPTAVNLTVGNSNAANGSATNPNTLNPVFSGILSNTNGAASVTKVGSNTQTFAGANTYTGGTTVSAGMLLLTNTSGSGTGTGAVGVNGAGTLLGGTGTVSGAVTIGNGAILAGGIPGSTIGALTLTGTTTLVGGSIIELTLGAGNTHSTLMLTGATIPTGERFIFLNSQPGTYNDIVTGVPATAGTAPFTVSNTDFTYSFTYDGANNIDLSVTAVPEPSTWAATLLALGAMGIYRFRRTIRNA